MRDQQAQYERWMAECEGPTAALKRAVRAMVRQPLIALVLPVYNPPIELLESAINSVRRQIYPRWELCIADDASTDPHVRLFLEQAAAAEPRIKLVLREKNGHISACSNSALQLVTGEWCGLLDQDDELHETALAYVALEALQNSDAGLIYSDEDKMDQTGARVDPYFKPDWNPELLLAANYINHLAVYRTALIREVGGFRIGFEGSQDYDLVLRVTERLTPEQIRHLPRVLYHWRAVRGSVAAVIGAKPYAKEAARSAIGEHLQREQIRARVEACPENAEFHRVVYELPEPAPLVSVIIPTRDRVKLLAQCIASLHDRTEYAPLEIVIIDNGSREAATRDFLQSVDARVLRDEGEFNFSRLINRGAAAAKGTVLALLNNDIEAQEPRWLREMVSQAMRPNIGAVGARLWYPDGRLQHAGVVVGLGGVAGHILHGARRGTPGYFNRLILPQNCAAVTAACMAVRKEVFDSLGGFDAEHLPISFNDIDFCLRLRQRGLCNIWTPYADLLHHESASRGHQATVADRAQFVHEAAYMHEKWGAELLRDPFYNPNFSLNWPGLEIRCPAGAASGIEPGRRE